MLTLLCGSTMIRLVFNGGVVGEGLGQWSWYRIVKERNVSPFAFSWRDLV